MKGRISVSRLQSSNSDHPSVIRVTIMDELSRAEFVQMDIDLANEKITQLFDIIKDEP